MDGLLGVLMQMQAREAVGISEVSGIRSDNSTEPRNASVPASTTRHPIGNLKDINEVHKFFEQINSGKVKRSIDVRDMIRSQR